MQRHAILLLLVTSCTPFPPPDDMGTDTDTDTGATDSVGSTSTTGPSTTTGGASSTTSTTTSTTNATDSASGSTGEPEECTYHCFRRIPPISLPYNPNPVDVNGNSTTVPFVCDLFPSGTLNLVGMSFPLDEPACVSKQSDAEAAYDQGVCNPGPVPQPPSMGWQDLVVRYADAQHRNCRRTLMGLGCQNSDQPTDAGTGSNEICDAYMRFQLRLDMLFAAPQLEEIDPQTTPPIPGVPCDYEDNLTCG